MHAREMEIDGILGPGEEDDALLRQVQRHAEPLLQRTLVVADLQEANLVGAPEQDRRDHLREYGGRSVVLIVPADRIVDQVLHLLGRHRVVLRKCRRNYRHAPGGEARGDQGTARERLCRHAFPHTLSMDSHGAKRAKASARLASAASVLAYASYSSRVG